MEDVIRQVIESEYRARKIVGEAEERRSYLSTSIEDEIQKIKNDIFASVESKIEKIRKEKLSLADDQAGKIMTEAENAVSLMQQKYESNRQKWAKSFMDVILGDDFQSNG